MSSAPQNETNVRIDKWLWAARFYKTRAMAKDMVDGGKVHYNGQRCKPSKAVSVGAIIKLRQGFDEKIVEILALSSKRLSAPLAQELYKETDESKSIREKEAQARRLGFLHSPARTPKPDKKQRRKIKEFKDKV